MSAGSSTSHARILEYDRIRHRVWILGQRCHHGATGSVVATLACLGLATSKPAVSARSLITLAATGGALMAHDWKDRAIWFARGPQR